MFVCVCDCVCVCVGMQTSSLLDTWSSQRRRRLRLRERLLLRSGRGQVIQTQTRTGCDHPTVSSCCMIQQAHSTQQVSQLLSCDGKLRIQDTASARPRRSCTEHHFLETAFGQQSNHPGLSCSATAIPVSILGQGLSSIPSSEVGTSQLSSSVQLLS